MEVFKSAGKEPGLQVWRVEKMDLRPVPREYYGSFYIGDTYIILYTISEVSFNVHTWTGKDASQDESGAAAIFMVQLDDHLKGSPRQFVEFQGEESHTFMNYFPHGPKYQKGGVASGFTHVVTNECNCKRAYHVKGRHNIRSKEVDLHWSSFNSGDCFIIDLGKNIYHWSGSDSNRFERLKTMSVAIDIRDNESKGRAKIHMIMEGDEPDEVIEVLGPKPDLPPGSSDAEVPVSRKDRREASLYMISDAAGSMKETLVAEKIPFKQEMLNQNECYILDNRGDHKIFVWKGSKANKDERKAAYQTAQQFIKDHNCPCRTQVQVLPAGAETTLFKEFFFNWMDKYETTGPGQTYTVGSIARVEKIPFDASSLHDNTAMAAQHGMVDDGSGEVQIWRVEGNDKKPVDASTYGQFFGGDCYLVQYSYIDGGRERHIIYFWQGNSCSKDELGASAILAVKLDDSMGGVATQVRVTQGLEPPHLVSLFQGKLMIIYLGGTSRSEGQSRAGDTRLFHIRLSSTNATRAVEVEPRASSLNSNDVFVLKTSNNEVIVWKGVGAADEEMAAAKYLAEVLEGSVTEVEEKSEPDSFWAALGGKQDYQTSKALRDTVKLPRLFACSNKTGRLIVDEVPGDFTQMELATDDIMILDTCHQIYLWIGKEANDEEKQGAAQIAQDYLDTDPSGRRGIPISTIHQGQEPPSFTGWFQAWDPNMWDKKLQDLISMFSH